MNTLQINIPTFYGTRRIKRKAPDNFNDVPKQMLLQLVRLIFTDMDIIDKKTLATKVLFKLKWWHVFLFTPVQMAYMNTFTTWLFDGEHFLTENKVDSISVGSIRFGRVKFYGPIGDFETLRGNEWTDADSAYTEWVETQDEEHLNNLVAILWRPKNKLIDRRSEHYQKDLRVKYNPHTVERRAAEIAKIDPAIKYAILLWYRGCRHEWEEMFDRVFDGKTQEAVEHYGWPETIQKVAGKIFGNLAETENTPMYKLLFNMQVELKDYEHFKQKQEMKNG